MNSKEYTLPNGKKAVFEYDVCGIGKITLECMDELMGMIADRPQGEWIRTGRTNIYGGIEVQCSNCGDKVMVQHLEDEWFCRHCGADMGMKGASDERVVKRKHNRCD